MPVDQRVREGRVTASVIFYREQKDIRQTVVYLMVCLTAAQLALRQLDANGNEEKAGELWLLIREKKALLDKIRAKLNQEHEEKVRVDEGEP